mmetsp:Transcript_19808/g.26769  ORF Transcript_19808/g.26769 Transcript_19808/m.26769 type:complete len:86 (-) Transcript_19808:48-305(-)
MIGICKNFFKNMQTNYELNPKRELARQIRMKEFNVDMENEMDGVSPDGKFYRVKPIHENRIFAKEGEVPEKLMRKLTTARVSGAY